MSPKQPILVMLCAIALLASARGAGAFPDAQVDAQMRPHFGELLNPPIRRYHPYRPVYRDYRWQSGQYGQYQTIGQDYGHYQGPWVDSGWRRNHGYPIQGPIQTITVDCGDASAGSTPLSDALFALADGGTLYIKSGGRACGEALVITRPVNIVGEPASAFSSDGSGPPVIAPPPGAACIQVMPGAGRVEVRDLILRADHAGAQPCVQSWDSDLALVHADIRYAGEASAVFASGGHFIARHSQVGSGGYEPAVATENAALDFDGLEITASVNGLDITPGAGVVNLDKVGINVAPGVDPSLIAETGLTVRYARHGSDPINFHGGHISGFRTGIWLDQGARAQVAATTIGKAQIAVVSRAADLNLVGSTLTVSDTGVYVVMGQAKILHNTIHEMGGPPIVVDRGADVLADDNAIYPFRPCREFRDYRGPCHEWVPPKGHEHDHDHDRDHDRDRDRERARLY